MSIRKIQRLDAVRIACNDFLGFKVIDGDFPYLHKILLGSLSREEQPRTIQAEAWIRGAEKTFCCNAPVCSYVIRVCKNNLHTSEVPSGEDCVVDIPSGRLNCDDGRLHKGQVKPPGAANIAGEE